MRLSQAARHVAEEGRDLGLNRGVGIDLARAVQQFRAALLMDVKPVPQPLGDLGQRPGGRFRQHARALAAARDQDVKLAVADVEPAILQRADVGPHRIAHHLDARLQRRRSALKRREGRRDLPGPSGQQAVGAAEHGVLFMDDGRPTLADGGHQGGHGGVAAEAHDHARVEPGKGRARLAHASQYLEAGPDHLDRVFRRRSVERQPFLGREFMGVLGAPLIGRQHHAPAPRGQRLGQGLGGKQMAAGAPGGENRDLAHPRRPLGVAPGS